MNARGDRHHRLQRPARPGAARALPRRGRRRRRRARHRRRGRGRRPSTGRGSASCSTPPGTPTSTAPRPPRAGPLAWRVNARAVANLARVALARGLTLVHVSTDYVFDGTRRAVRRGRGLLAARASTGRARRPATSRPALVPRHYLLRTSWVIGDGKNFVRTMLDLARRGVDPAVVVGPDRPPDVHRGAGARRSTTCSPPAPRTARTTSATAARPSRGRISRARSIARPGCRTRSPTSRPPRTRPAPGRWPRARGSTLVLDKLEATGFAPRDWREALGDYLAAGSLPRPIEWYSKPSCAHPLRVVDVAPVDDQRALHQLLHPVEVRVAEVVPLGDEDQPVGAGERVVAVLAEVIRSPKMLLRLVLAAGS